MYCPECGARNTDDAAFCGECAAKLRAGRPAAPYPQFGAGSAGQGPGAQKAALNPKAKKLILAVLGALFCVVAFFVAGSIIASPDRVAKAYYNSVSAGNYDKAYGCIALPDSPFLTREAYRKIAENQAGGGGLKLERDKKRSTAEKIVYSLKRNEKQSALDLFLFGEDDLVEGGFELIRTGRTLLVFGKYRVRLDGMIARDCTITALRGAAVTVDGIAPLPDIADEDDEPGVDRYTIPYIFICDYEVEVTHPLCEAYSKSVRFSTGRGHDVTRMDLSESAREGLAEQVEALVPELYDAALLEGAPFSELNLPLTADPLVREAAEEKYDDWKLSNRTQDGEALYQSIEYKDFKDESHQTEFGPALTYQCRVSWTADYVKLEKVRLSDDLEAKEGSRSWTMELVFVFENDQWLIQEIKRL